MTFTIRHTATYQGPNVWHRSPVTYLNVDFGPLGNASHEVAGISESYLALADLVHRGTSLDPLPMPGFDDLATTAARIALNLQRVAGVRVDFSAGRERTDSSHDVVVQHRHPQVGLAAGRLAIRWLAHWLGADASAFDLSEEFQRFNAVVSTNDHGVMGRAIADAAELRGIPQTVVDPRGRIVELGNGRYRQRIFGVSTSRTPAIGEHISRDKHLTNHYLREAGLPVPDSISVRSVGQALDAIRTIGYPVVIKPLDLCAAIGVSLDLRSEAEARAGYEMAAAAGSSRSGTVVVERFVPGHDFRALVVNDRVISVRQRVRPEITGDGLHSIEQLIEIENTDPRRGTHAVDVYKQIVIDEFVLQRLGRLGLSLEDVPDRGQTIELKLSGNRQDGALHIDCTDQIHPANIALLRTATSVLGLDIAGIDIITPDIAQPIGETGGVIIEVNDGPAFNLHLFPASGLAQDPGPAMMEMLFPPGQPVRVPVVAVLADDDSAAICRSVGRSMTAAGWAVGLATENGLVVNWVPYPGVDARNPAGPRTLLNNPTVEAAVVEVSAASIVEHGLGFDVCDVAVILALSGLETPFGQPVETVLLSALDAEGTAILKGSDPAVRALADRWEGAVVFVETADAAVAEALACLVAPIGHVRPDGSGPL